MYLITFTSDHLYSIYSQGKVPMSGIQINRCSVVGSMCLNQIRSNLLDSLTPVIQLFACMTYVMYPIYYYSSSISPILHPVLHEQVDCTAYVYHYIGGIQRFFGKIKIILTLYFVVRPHIIISKKISGIAYMEY